jgi:hypothetical protein
MNKKLYSHKLEATLTAWDAKINLLKARAANKEPNAKIKLELREKIDDLERKKSRAHSKLDELMSAEEQSWQELRPGVDEAVADLKIAVDDAVSTLM